jgi:hypothetical protein
LGRRRVLLLYLALRHDVGAGMLGGQR